MDAYGISVYVMDIWIDTVDNVGNPIIYKPTIWG